MTGSGLGSGSSNSSRSGLANGAALRGKLALAKPAMAAAYGRLWRTPFPRQRYLHYLYAMHAVIRASVPLMEAALVRCTAMGDDPVAAPLARYLRAHIGEERGHDEWLCQDIAATGNDPGDLLRHVPPASAAAMAGAQYYWLAHFHPVTLLGYVAVLEGDPPDPGLAGHLAAATGFPDTAFRTLARHAEADPGHGEHVFALLDMLPLTPELQTAVGLAALHTAAAAVSLLGELAGPHGDHRPAEDGAAWRLTPP